LEGGNGPGRLQSPREGELFQPQAKPAAFIVMKNLGGKRRALGNPGCRLLGEESKGRLLGEDLTAGQKEAWVCDKKGEISVGKSRLFAIVMLAGSSDPLRGGGGGGHED